MTSQNNFYGFDPALVQAQAGPEIDSTQAQFDSLRQSLDDQIRNHTHSGTTAQRIQLGTDIDGLFETVSTAPTTIPRTIFDQVKVYANGGTYRLYVYDSTSQNWRYAALT